MHPEEIHVGDRVRIRQWDDLAAEYGIVYRGNPLAYINTPRWIFLKDMQKLCGLEYTVKMFNDLDGTYIFELDSPADPVCDYLITAAMLEPADELIADLPSEMDFISMLMPERQVNKIETF